MGYKGFYGYSSVIVALVHLVYGLADAFLGGLFFSPSVCILLPMRCLQKDMDSSLNSLACIPINAMWPPSRLYSIWNFRASMILSSSRCRIFVAGRPLGATNSSISASIWGADNVIHVFVFCHFMFVGIFTHLPLLLYI